MAIMSTATTITMFCATSISYVRSTPCKPYMYECAYSEGYASDERLLTCIKMRIADNFSWKSEPKIPQCTTESKQKHERNR